MSKKPRIPYASMDTPILGLCRAINSFPGVYTIGSCGGHEEGGELPADQWRVTFRTETDDNHRPTLAAWLSLEFIAWVIRDMGRAGEELDMAGYSLPPYLNGPGETMSFEIWGRRPTGNPDGMAKYLRDLKQGGLYVRAQALPDYYRDEEATPTVGSDALREAETEPASEEPDDNGQVHPTIEIFHSEMRAEVDVELAPLVLELWRAGIDTFSCCQDVGESLEEGIPFSPHFERLARHGVAYIEFVDPDSVSRFYNALSNSGPRDAFYERMTHWAAPGAWERTFAIEDEILEAQEPVDWSRPSRFWIGSFQVSFPVSDISEMLSRMRRFNAGEKVELGEPMYERRNQ